MSRSEARTPEAWRSFDRAAIFVSLAGLLVLLLLWWSGYGPSRPGCCAAPVAVSPATPKTPAPTPPPMVASESPRVEPTKVESTPPVDVAPAPAKVEAPMAEPAKAAPAIDCNKIVEGVAVHFATGSSTLTGQARVSLDEARLCVKDGSYEVAGHTDSVGSKATNQTLSEARAAAVVAYLSSKGVDAARLSARGFGETKPIADNSTAEGRAQNRRVTFTRHP